MSGNLPVVLIEVVLIFGGVLVFAWWQLRSVRRDRLEAAARRRREQPAEVETDSATPSDDERRP